jgi:hypothetical protein
VATLQFRPAWWGDPCTCMRNCNACQDDFASLTFLGTGPLPAQARCCNVTASHPLLLDKYVTRLVEHTSSCCPGNITIHPCLHVCHTCNLLTITIFPFSPLFAGLERFEPAAQPLPAYLSAKVLLPACPSPDSRLQRATRAWLYRAPSAQHMQHCHVEKLLPRLHYHDARHLTRAGMLRGAQKVAMPSSVWRP